ncbi:porin family protein [Vibrio makurazakiensis]|uniref:outer membrane protein n=1 Tax=Vibrio makurazakiensis TaxID=2910250 RepID=UPI003D0E417E
MNKIAKISSLISLFTCFYASAASNAIITPLVGYTSGGSVQDQEANTYDLEGSESFTFAVETPLEQGRVGLFYSNQQSELKTLKLSSSIQYLHFQSSIYYPANEKLSTYIGLGIGASYVDVDWADDKLGFSGSAFGGIEYKFTDTLSLNSQIRWLGTVVDNDTSGVCTVPTTQQSCIIKFETDWMNQFQGSIGLTFYF